MNRGWFCAAQDSSAFRIDVGWAQLDPIAVGIIILVTILICISTKESSRVNLVLVCTKLTGVLFVIIVGARALCTSHVNFCPSFQRALQL